jgi:hypothetical protein
MSTTAFWKLSFQKTHIKTCILCNVGIWLNVTLSMLNSASTDDSDRINVWKQRVLNDMMRTRLSRRRMILLLPLPPFPPLSRQQVFSRSQSSWVSLVELADGEGGVGRGGAKSRIAWSSINHSNYVWKYFLNLPHIWCVCPTEDIIQRWQPKISAVWRLPVKAVFEATSLPIFFMRRTLLLKKLVLSIKNFIRQSGRCRTKLSVWRKINLFPSSWMFGPASTGGFIAV